MTPRGNNWLDRSAMSLSGLCLVHCFGGSLLLTGLTAAGGFWSHQVHAIGLMLALPLAAVALLRGLRAHRRGWPMLLGGVGLAMMAGSLLLPHGAGEVAVSMAGAALLGLAHLINLRLLRV